MLRSSSVGFGRLDRDYLSEIADILGILVKVLILMARRIITGQDAIMIYLIGRIFVVLFGFVSHLLHLECPLLFSVRFFSSLRPTAIVVGVRVVYLGDDRGDLHFDLVLNIRLREVQYETDGDLTVVIGLCDGLLVGLAPF